MNVVYLSFWVANKPEIRILGDLVVKPKAKTLFLGFFQPGFAKRAQKEPVSKQHTLFCAF